MPVLGMRGALSASAFGFGGAARLPIYAEYTSTQSVDVPPGALYLTVELINCGEKGDINEDPPNGNGDGGGYARKNNYSLAGISSLTVTIPNDAAGSQCSVVTNTAVTLVLTNIGTGGTNTGDQHFTGGTGSNHGGTWGGAAGYLGNGSSTSGGHNGGYLNGQPGMTGLFRGEGGFNGGFGEVGGALFKWMFAAP